MDTKPFPEMTNEELAHDLTNCAESTMMVKGGAVMEAARRLRTTPAVNVATLALELYDNLGWYYEERRDRIETIIRDHLSRATSAPAVNAAGERILNNKSWCTKGRKMNLVEYMHWCGHDAIAEDLIALISSSPAAAPVAGPSTERLAHLNAKIADLNDSSDECLLALMERDGILLKQQLTSLTARLAQAEKKYDELTSDLVRDLEVAAKAIRDHAKK